MKLTSIIGLGALNLHHILNYAILPIIIIIIIVVGEKNEIHGGKQFSW